MNFVLMIFGATGGAAATSFLQRNYGMTAVVASSLVGLLGAVIGFLWSKDYLPAAVFAGSFAGMTASAIAPLGATVLAGAGAGVLCALVTVFNIFPGYGGKLGTIAFISTGLVLRIAGASFRK